MMSEYDAPEGYLSSMSATNNGQPASFKVLFVCTGNICRSPTAEGVFRAMAEAMGMGDRIDADSAGTSACHTGEPPDERSQAAALARGIDLSDQRGRQVTMGDFDTFDLIVALDRVHHRDLLRVCPRHKADRVKLLLEYAPQVGTRDVPDPYFAHQDGFGHVLDLIEAGTAGLLREIRGLVT